jgi:polysaccharide biosynthesis transport protein
MNLERFFRLLRAQWLVVLLFVVAGTVAMGVVAWTTTPTYAAQTKLFVSTRGEASDPDEAYQGGLFAQQRARSYAEMVSSPQVMQAVITKLRLRQTVEELEAAIDVSVPPETVLINVTAEDASPQRAKAIADAVGEEFPRFVGRLEAPQGSSGSPVSLRATSAARLSTDPVGPGKAAYLAVGALLGLVAGLGTAVLREALTKRVRNEEDAAIAADAAVLGSIADDPNADSRPLIVVDDPFSARAEAYRRVRTNLRALIVDHKLRSIIVSSAGDSEGKTVIAANLGVALAQAGYRVVLVDADLRRPGLARMLGLSSSPGLTDVLAEGLPLDAALQTWRQGVPLEIIGSGSTSSSPSDLLSSPNFRVALTALEERADLVILDTPAALPFSDAATVAQLASGVVLVSRAGSTPAAKLRAAAEALRPTGEPVIVVVLNRVPMRASSFPDGAVEDRVGESRPTREGPGRLQGFEQPGRLQ